jgi:hypothetical protein
MMTDTGSSDNVFMQDPLAFFITWPTYGTWLPGDERGWVEYHHGWQLPDPMLESACQSRMNEEQCVLTADQRAIVEAQVAETCRYRKWTLFAVSCRSNHLHILIGAIDTKPKKIRADVKAYCTRRLRAMNTHRATW